jgi:GNAT superfamily N-acetyltransferase
MTDAVCVRRAVPGDVDAMCDVMCRSIAELCAADHGNRPEEIADWTANKTPERVLAWIENRTHRIFVGVMDAGIVGVGGLIATDLIGVLYVSPDARFKGVSKALLARLEGEMRALGTRYGRLESSKTAHAFYLAAGWRDEAEGPTERGGLWMRKQLD